MYTISSVYRQGNLKLAYRRIITNPESTYKNYFRDTYSFYAMALDDNTKNIGVKLKAGYMPDHSIRVFMPKSIDDRLCSLVVLDHSELGGYSLGTVGGISNSKGFKNHLPAFHKMVNEIHELRLTSHLSHSMIRRTNNYTGPIKGSERKRILSLITAGINELTLFW